MTCVSVEEAGSQLALLIAEASSGKEVVITQNDQPVARLVSVPPPAAAVRERQPGSARGVILHMAEDFDAPLDEFKEYME